MNQAQKKIAEQAKRIAELEQENADLCAGDHLHQAYNQLSFQFKQFQRYRFGQHYETNVDPNDLQGLLFDLSKDATDKDDQSDNSNVVNIKAHQRKKQIKKGFAGHLTRNEFHIKVPDEDRICGCGCTKVPLKPRVMNDYISNRRYLKYG